MTQKSGFTLIELLFTLAIIAILAMAAYPLYQQHITKVRRTEGQTALMALALRASDYYAENQTYLGMTLTAIGTYSHSTHGFYRLAIPSAHLSDTTYLLQAIPQGAHAQADLHCGTLTFDQTGKKGFTGNGKYSDCW